ncbi:Scube3 [Symbiodinium sp. KB8]|nr:Scube3 [Symbiodinium sp. KB8]
MADVLACDAYPYFLRTAPPDSIQGRAFWKWIVTFQVPLAVCIYASEPYGQGFFLAMEELAKAAGEEDRLKGVSVRYMSNNFVEAEALAALVTARNLGSRFLFTSMNSQMFNNFAPVMRSEGMLGPGWQVLGSESAVAYGPEILDSDLPVGFMRWNPVDKGLKFADYAAMWQQLNLNDVNSASAKERYGIDNYKVPFLVPPMTQEDFTSQNIPQFGTFLFDALYTIVVAANNLLNQGLPLADVKGETLLNELKQTTFTGITGDINFDVNGDRLASYELLVSEPVTEGWASTQQVVSAIFSASTGELILSGQELYWMDGKRGALPPPELTSCEPGFYKEEQSNQCKACPRGFYCEGGIQPYQQCPRGSYAKETGMINCTLCPLGHFAGEVGSSSCSTCPAGFYAGTLGLEACTRCEKGTYVSTIGAHRCVECGMRQVPEESGAQKASDCKCAEGTFMCSGVGCLDCPQGLRCISGLLPPVQEPGFWTAVEGPNQCRFSVLRCRDALECPENLLGGCAEGREGLACNNCREGYYSLEGGACAPCSPGDVLPFILTGIFATVVVIFLFSSVNADLNQQSLSIITVAAIFSQMVMAIQALGSIRQLSINWVGPVRHLIDLTRLFTFDFDIIRISCLAGQDSPTVKFVCQLLAFPMGSCLILVAWGITWLWGRKASLDSVFNLNGLLIFALFITLALAVLRISNPAPRMQWRDVAGLAWADVQVQDPPSPSLGFIQRGIICYSSSEHLVLVGLSITGIICYPMTILSWATYTTVMYPLRIVSGKGLQLMNRYRFLFQRFRPECYYYGLVLLFRNAFVALLPVVLASMPELQVLLMGVLFVLGWFVQVRTWPWRTQEANYADSIMTGFLLVVLLAAGPLLKIDEDKSAEMLGWLLLFAVMGPAVVGVGAVCFAVFRHFCPRAVYGIFLCHHKGGSGSLCRLIKLLVARHSPTNVFLDSDQLEELDLIFDTVRSATKNVVAVQTSELLTRMWCAGEIVTAHRNKVTTIPVICDDFIAPTNEALELIPDVWTAQQKQILANYGITMDDVKKAYVWLRDALNPLYLSRFGSAEKRELTVVEMLKRSKVSMNVLGYVSCGPLQSKARILITGSVADAEALATCEVFQILVQRHLRTECALVRSEKEMVAYRPWAYYFVVLFSRGMLRDPHFAQILLATGAGAEEAEDATARHLEIVTVSADAGFEFPSAEFYNELAVNGLGQEGLGPEIGLRLSKAYRSLLNVLALPLSPMGSEGLLERQTSEISRRFRRYKDPAAAQALDEADDTKSEDLRMMRGMTWNTLSRLDAEAQQSLSMRTSLRAKAEDAMPVAKSPEEEDYYFYEESYSVLL